MSGEQPAPGRLKILVVCHEYPRPDVAASNRRLVDMLQLISKHHDVDMICPHYTRSLVEGRYEALYRSMGVRILFDEAWGLRRHLLRRVYDVCIFEWWVTVRGAIDEIRRNQPWATLIVDAVDVCFRREEAAVALGHLDPATVAENRRLELDAYRLAHALLSVTSDDMATLKECGLSLPTYFIPMIEPIVPRPTLDRGHELLFVGTFGLNIANVDGVLWFVKEVWPSVRESVPDAKLTLVGSNLTPEIEALAKSPGVEVAGFVPDLEPYLNRAAVSIAPLRFGGGMKGKVTEAMSHGLPVVTTSFGVQGLEATSGEQLIVADDARDFARGVIELLQDEEKAGRIGRAGQSFIAGLCSPEVVETQVDAFLGWAKLRNPPRTPSMMLRWGMKSAINRVGDAMNRVKTAGKRATPPFVWNGLATLKRRARGPQP